MRPGEKAVKIIAASPYSIRVATNHSRAFETDLPWIAWQSGPEEFPWRWHAVPNETTDAHLAHFGCPYTFWTPPLLPNLFVRPIDQIEVKNCRMLVGIDQANYVILEDGTIWVWEYQKSTGND